MNPTESPTSTVTTPGAASPGSRVHPMVIAAAAAITLLAAAGIATLLYTRFGATEERSLAAKAVQDAPAAAAEVAGPAPAPLPATSTSVPTTTATASAVAPIEEVGPQGTGAPRYPAPPAGAGARPPGYGAPVGPALATAALPPACVTCATIVSFREVRVAGEASGVGAVGGGLAGGVVGHQIGSGNGRTAMTVLGAIGGAIAGNAIEKNARARTEYEMVVRYDDGHTRTFMSPRQWPYNVGDPIRVINGAVRPRG